MVKDTIFVAGNEQFNTNLVNRFTTNSVSINTVVLNEKEKQAGELLSNLKAPIDKANVVFVHTEPNLFPVAELALRRSKHVVLFGVQKCTHQQLIQLLDLSIESKSLLVNGDSLLFNPIIFQTRKWFHTLEMSTLSSNRFNQFISRRSIFNCLELLLYMSGSPVKNVSVKVVQLNGTLINLLHTRLEFENGDLAVLEMSNCKPGTKLVLEASGEGTWLSLDLLTFNGKKHIISTEDNLTPPEQVYATERNSMNNLLTFIHQDLPTLINPHQQFSNSIATSNLIRKMEEQLRREVPNFTRFKNDEKDKPVAGRS